MSRYKTKEAVHNRAKDAIGTPLELIYEQCGQYDANPQSKNYVGDAFEAWMDVPKNSRAEADLSEAGVELKATPYKILKDGRPSAKERLVLNIVNYMNEAKATFETSSFANKDKLMELIFYKNDPKNKDKSTWTFDEAILFSFPEKDLEVIKHDWETIHDMIMQGKAHELSEGMTDYLGACTKGASSKTLRDQPFSDIKAKQRAYSLKASYMTSILRNYVFGSQTDPAIQKDKFSTRTMSHSDSKCFSTEEIATVDELAHKGLDDIIRDKLNVFSGKTVAELKKIFNINISKKTKQLNSILIARMLGLKGDSANEAEEIQKADIQVKTISLKKNGKIKEHMSFPAFKFSDIQNTDFEDSDFYESISKKFLFAVFKRLRNQNPSDDEIVFIGAKCWYLPADDIKNIELVYNDTKRKIQQGVHLKSKINSNNKVTVSNNFIGSSDYSTDGTKYIAHVRPHARLSQYFEGAYSNELPVPAVWSGRPDDDEHYDPSGRFMPTQSFWLNSTYLNEQIRDVVNAFEKNSSETSIDK